MERAENGKGGGTWRVAVASLARMSMRTFSVSNRGRGPQYVESWWPYTCWVLTVQLLDAHVSLRILTRSNCLAVVVIHSRLAGHRWRAPLLSQTTVLFGNTSESAVLGHYQRIQTKNNSYQRLKWINNVPYGTTKNYYLYNYQKIVRHCVDAWL